MLSACQAWVVCPVLEVFPASAAFPAWVLPGLILAFSIREQELVRVSIREQELGRVSTPVNIQDNIHHLNRLYLSHNHSRNLNRSPNRSPNHSHSPTHLLKLW